jgi:hypothetical protein
MSFTRKYEKGIVSFRTQPILTYTTHLLVCIASEAHNLEPKINVLELKVEKVQKHELELHDIIKVNTERLNQIDVQCKKVNNWMMALAGGGPSDVFDEVQADDSKKETGGETGIAQPREEHHKEHHKHHQEHHTSK